MVTYVLCYLVIGLCFALLARGEDVRVDPEYSIILLWPIWVVLFLAVLVAHVWKEVFREKAG